MAGNIGIEHARALTQIYVNASPAKRPAPHDLSASQSEAARSECVGRLNAAPHDLLSSGGNEVWFATTPPDMEASCKPDQQNGSSSRYTFSAKEKDDETQYSYFGARYYDSDLSVWLSVDPMAKQRPWISPNNYCLYNPMNKVDPTGMIDDVFGSKAGTGDKFVTGWEFLYGGYKFLKIEVTYESSKTTENAFDLLREGVGFSVTTFELKQVMDRDE